MSGSGALLHAGGGFNQHETPGQLPVQPQETEPAASSLLYDLFEQRVFNFCHRLLGSCEEAAHATQEAFLAVLTAPHAREGAPHAREGHDQRFRLQLFAAARASCQQILAAAGERAVVAVDEPDQAPDEVFAEPDRALLLSSLQADVRAANLALSPPQREVLALRELEYFSYAEIADIVGGDADGVAELMVSARLAIRDQLRPGSVSHPVATGPDCRRAMPLIAKAQDGQLEAPDEREWLAGHMTACGDCPASREAMEEAGISYRAWLRILPPPWLRDVTATRAGELAGGAAAAGTTTLAEADAAPVEEVDPAAEGRAAKLDDEPDLDGEPPTALTAPMVATEADFDNSDARRRFALGAASTLLVVLGVATALVLASQGGGDRGASSPPRAPTAGQASRAGAPAPVVEAASSTPSRRRTPRRQPRTTTLSEGQRSSLRQTRSAATSRPQPRRRPSRRRPVGQRTEGGGFVPKATAPAPPQAPAKPSTPTLSPRPAGGVPAPPAGGCPNASGAPGSC